MFTGGPPGPQQQRPFGPPGPQQQRPPGPPGPQQQRPLGPPGGPQDQPPQAPPPHQMNFTGEMPNYEEGNVIRTREIMYRLIISQLFYDGYSQAAIQVRFLCLIFSLVPSNFPLPRESELRNFSKLT